MTFKAHRTEDDYTRDRKKRQKLRKKRVHHKRSPQSYEFRQRVIQHDFNREAAERQGEGSDDADDGASGHGSAEHRLGGDLSEHDMSADKYVEAYNRARSNGTLDAVALAIGCPVEALANYRSTRRIVGHQRATRIRQAFIDYGCVDKTSPISDLFPRWSSIYRLPESPRRAATKADDRCLLRVPGTLADLWLKWLKDEKLTVQTITDDVMRDCGIDGGRPKRLSTDMEKNCRVFLHHAPLIADQWINEKAA